MWQLLAQGNDEEEGAGTSKWNRKVAEQGLNCSQAGVGDGSNHQVYV